MQRIFPRAVLACMSEARAPRPFETEAVAAKIWQEAFAPRMGMKSWHEVPRGSSAYRRTIAAACAALGCSAPTLDWSVAA